MPGSLCTFNFIRTLFVEESLWCSLKVRCLFRMYERTRPRRPIAAMFKSPGPCHNLRSVVGYEEHCLSKRRLPAYSFRTKGKGFSDDCSPGPKYALEKGFTRTGPDGSTKVTISGRHADFTQFQTPSPGTYLQIPINSLQWLRLSWVCIH